MIAKHTYQQATQHCLAPQNSMLTRASGGGCGPSSSDPEPKLPGLGGAFRFIAGTLGPETAAMDGRGRGASEPTERRGEWGEIIKNKGAILPL